MYFQSSWLSDNTFGVRLLQRRTKAVAVVITAKKCGFLGGIRLAEELLAFQKGVCSMESGCIVCRVELMC
jgi:hypothetical protein